MDDLAQPAAERFRHAELFDLLHGLNEHILSQFFRFVGVANSAHCQRNDAGPVSFKQLAECFSIASLGRREPGPQPFVSLQQR